MGDHAVVVEDLRKTFRGRGKSAPVEALRGVDLTVDAGTVLGVLGPNGAGKTTAVRILTTLLQPDGGSAQVLGHDVVHQAAAVRRLIGLTGQSTAIVDELTGRENLEMVGRLNHLARSEARSRAEALLQQFDLADAGERQAKTYSGGMLRRLDLAAGLVAHPPVLFLDEPTTGLDPRSRIGMWDVIRSLVAGGTTLLLTTQYLDEADELADSIVVIDHGKVIARGTASELKTQIGGDVIEFTVPDRGQISAAADSVAHLGDRGVDVDRETGLVSVRVGASGSEALLDAVRRLDAAKVTVTGLALRRPSLDDVFLALTGRPAEESSDVAPPDQQSADATKVTA
ncbi:MAG TPA: ATP-binding cassette domain-containing protein [Mycobacteriales bacterium]|nr:ATP-binding cassette domain-containing protein [Mycobacteriales bacterium]